MKKQNWKGLKLKLIQTIQIRELLNRKKELGDKQLIPKEVIKKTYGKENRLKRIHNQEKLNSL